MKPIVFDNNQEKEIINLYTIEFKSTNFIGEKFNVHKAVIKKVLSTNNITLRNPGQRDLGGKAVAQKKYEEKLEIKIKRSEYYKEWVKDKKIILKSYLTNWRDENREQLKIRAREYEREKCKDPTYRLNKNIRTALWTNLKEFNVIKNKRTFELLGYSSLELINHLENLFTEGMTWDNYGEWHVDHKRPIASFSFKTTDEPEFNECWSLTNLQPLWGLDNYIKGSKMV